MDPLGEWSLKLLESGFWKTPIYGICALWALFCLLAGSMTLAERISSTELQKTILKILSFIACLLFLVLSEIRPIDIFKARAVTDIQLLISQWQFGDRNFVNRFLSNPPKSYEDESVIREQSYSYEKEN